MKDIFEGTNVKPDGFYQYYTDEIFGIHHALDENLHEHIARVNEIREFIRAHHRSFWAFHNGEYFFVMQSGGAGGFRTFSPENERLPEFARYRMPRQLINK